MINNIICKQQYLLFIFFIKNENEQKAQVYDLFSCCNEDYETLNNKNNNLNAVDKDEIVLKKQKRVLN